MVVASVLAAAALGGHARPAAAAALAGPWCGGSEETAADRQPDAVSGQQIHVIYAVPSDRPDRFAQVAPLIVDDLAAGDRWWRSQDAGRTLRFDLYAFPGCGSSAGMLDISVVRLPHEALFYDVSLDQQGAFLRNDLGVVQPNPYKKYLLYYDGPAGQSADACGYSPRLADSGGLAATSIVLLQQGEGCGTLGSGGIMAAAAVHELTHNLGAVPFPGPPHACPGDPGHICDDPHDLMQPRASADFIGGYVLDAGRDDYYGHSGDWWDLQDSPWLVRLDAPQFPLTLHITGSAAGTVASDLPGLACESSCTVNWQGGTSLSLSASPPDGNATFVGWSGACTGTNVCQLAIDGPKDVIARFDYLIALSLKVVTRGGSGTVSESTGDTCDSACDVSTPKGSLIDLVAHPAPGSRFVGWTGACTGQGRCSVLADAAKSVAAVFGPATARVTVRVRGKGMVTSAPAGISCPSRCAGSFRFDQQVRLIAHPAKGIRFAGWSGGCTGRTRCVVAAGTARGAVTAVFGR